MAWFDILAGVGEGLGQANQNFQQQLLLRRQREDQLKREEEERRRFELSEARLSRAEERATALEKRDTARMLAGAYEPGTTVSVDDVQSIAALDPSLAKAQFVKQPDGTYLVRDTTQAKAARATVEKLGYEVKALGDVSKARETFSKIMDDPTLANKYNDRALAALAVTAGYPEETLIPADRRKDFLLQQAQFRFQADENRKQRGFQASEGALDRAARQADQAAARAADDALRTQEFNLKRAAEYRQYFKDWFAQTYQSDPDVYELNPEQELKDRAHVRQLFDQDYPPAVSAPPVVTFTPRAPTRTTPKNSIGRVLGGGSR